MALSAFTGNFVQPVSTNASFAVTGVGFQPKAIILYATDETAAGVSTNNTWYQGFATSTSSRAAVSQTQLTATNTAQQAHDNAKCFIVWSAAGSSLVLADLVSFDVGGFTLNFSKVDTIARKIAFIALGGSDLTNAFVKQFLPAGSSGNQSFTGVGFKPDAMIVMSAELTSAPPANASGEQPVTGFASGTGALQAGAFSDGNNGTASGQRADVLNFESACVATLTSFDSDGFTLNFSQFSYVPYWFALCLKGGQYHVGKFNQATSTGNQATTGVGFQPTGLILASYNAVTNASDINSQARMSFGSGTSSSARASIWTGGSNGGVQDNDFDATKIINMITEGASPTTNASADLVSLDSGGFTLNWTTADATAREVIYLAMGSNAGGTVQYYSALASLGVG
jgi:hypothetical protein